MALVVDSSVFIGLERRGLRLSALSRLALEETVCLSSITVSELLAGVHRATNEAHALRRAAWIEQIVQVVPVSPFDTTVARVHARLWADQQSIGRPIGSHDLIIAATALAHGYGVLTENVQHFGRVPGLVVLQPTW